MSTYIRNPNLPCLHKQRGAVLMLMLIILVVGATTMMLNSLNSAAALSGRSGITSTALAQAREGLIGRATSDANHPGSLPCPDTINNGTADVLVGGVCPSYIGRLPWKTLGLPNLRDESGESLWYALSPNYRDFTNIINSNTPGTLQVYDSSGTTLLTPAGYEATAIIFAPGAIVGTQQRNAANQNSALNYLDIGPNNKDNSIGPFIAGNKTSSFNDRLMIITTKEIISIVEKRINQELASAFANYLPINGNKYPYPATFSNCTSSSCPSDTASQPTCVGKIPFTNFGSLLPTWFSTNNWFDVVYYTASKAVLPLISGGMGGMGGMGMGASGNSSCFNPITVSSINVNALFILPGVQLNGSGRLSLSSINLTSYFEDNANQIIDASYVTPSASSNDTLHKLP